MVIEPGVAMGVEYRRCRQMWKSRGVQECDRLASAVGVAMVYSGARRNPAGGGAVSGRRIGAHEVRMDAIG